MLMTFLLAVGVGLLAGPLVSFISRTPLHNPHQGVFVTPQLLTLIENTLARENFVGLSVAVVPRHAESEFHSWGYRTEDGDSVTPETLFYMASVSKAFCSTALGLLMDDFANGRNITALPPGLTELTWHTRLRELFPDWQLMDEWASERANLRDILSHVSGLPRHDFSYGPLDTPQRLIGKLKYLKPAFELREQWSYNNIMYIVATHVIETYSGQSYASFVEERIFGPLGMTSSTFSPTKAKAPGKFSQGWSKQGRRLPELFTEDVAFLMAGPAGVISNAVDMAKWVLMWVDRGVHNNQTIIPHSVYKNISYSRVVVVGPTDPEHSMIEYGMGWYRASYRGEDVVFHTGTMPGFSTLVSFLPNDDIGVILLANSEGKEKALSLILNRILDSVLNLDCFSPAPLNPAATWPRSPSSGHTTRQFSYQNLTVSPDDLAGTYANRGYGSFTLCSPSSASSSCAKVQSDFLAIDGVQGNPCSNGLVAEWPRVRSSHLRLRHLQGLVFEVYFTLLYPNGYGKDKTPFETKDPRIDAPNGLAEFMIEDDRVVGFGVSGLVGQPTERARKHGTVRDCAEVWFDKV